LKLPAAVCPFTAVNATAAGVATIASAKAEAWTQTVSSAHVPRTVNFNMHVIKTKFRTFLESIKAPLVSRQSTMFSSQCGSNGYAILINRNPMIDIKWNETITCRKMRTVCTNPAGSSSLRPFGDIFQELWIAAD
jgi:hypothetical protein